MTNPAERHKAQIPGATAESARHRVDARLLALATSHLVSRRHLYRTAMRCLVLAALDSLAVGGLVFALEGLRAAFAGRWLGAVLNASAPSVAISPVQVVIGALLGLVALGNYGPGDARRDGARLLAGAFLGFGLAYWAQLWRSSAVPLIAGYLTVSLLAGVLLLMLRVSADRLIYAWWPVGPGAARTLVIGSREDMRRVSRHPALGDRRGFRICGRFDAQQFALATSASLEEALCRSIRKYRADTLMLSVPLQDAHFSAVLSAAGVSGCQVLSLARTFALGAVEPAVIWVRGTPIVRLQRPTLRLPQLLVKRALDIAVSALGLIVLSPLLLLIALAVRVSSPGPVLFRQKRVGLAGRPFEILKFRSMVADAEERRQNLIARSLYKDARLFKVRNDPRVTRLGALLRRSSLDELPQLWNVFTGDMSLVGPRPPLPAEVAFYEAHHYARFEVKPGITGPWQVGGRNRLTDFERIIALETEYIRGWSIWKDLEILLRTVPAVFDVEGAH